MLNFLFSVTNWIVSLINDLGYFGIFLGMTLESSFFPFPSEIILIPAGALVYQGEMNFFLVFFFGLLGSLVGACINYFIAFFLGRTAVDLLLDKYGGFLFLTKAKLRKADKYFENYGEITTFVGRLIFVVRQLISLPAGFARMNFKKFILYTALGAAIWTAILILVGYFLGNTDISTIMKFITILLIGISILIVIIYRKFKRKNQIRYLC
ncbi:MAG: DedA family protein [Nanoarchaeota archaeon]|nr:DedA family protein [Nanoarchaeota archaeon]MBU1501836.1 DedA family protein [Nanoarchaeota archaeon]MBU2459365.1 DedA family protein [Nanoarchaeota archaeon]